MNTPIILLLKSLVAGYTRKDGTYVKPHSRKGGPAAKPGTGQLPLFAKPAEAAKPNPFKGKDPVNDTPDMFSKHPPEKVAWAKRVIANRDYMRWKDVKEAHEVLGIKDDDAEWAKEMLAASKKKSDVTTPRSEMIKEHERLVDVLESPSHADDKAEAKKQRKELEEYRTEAEQPKSRVLLTKPAKAGVLPDNPPYKDGILLLHGTKVEFMSGGKKRVGWVSNKYTEQQRKEGADITIRYGALNPSKPSAGRATVKEADITRIVEESPWGSDYKRS